MSNKDRLMILLYYGIFTDYFDKKKIWKRFTVKALKMHSYYNFKMLARFSHCDTVSLTMCFSVFRKNYTVTLGFIALMSWSEWILLGILFSVYDCGQVVFNNILDEPVPWQRLHYEVLYVQYRWLLGLSSYFRNLYL